MPVSEGFKNFVLEQLEQIASITSKSMFGGVGLYGDGFYMALIHNDKLFFKVDDTNRPDFEAAGMGPFRPYNDERTMQYYEVPVDVLEDIDLLRDWTKKAITVSQNSKKSKKRK